MPPLEAPGDPRGLVQPVWCCPCAVPGAPGPAAMSLLSGSLWSRELLLSVRLRLQMTFFFSFFFKYSFPLWFIIGY